MLLIAAHEVDAVKSKQVTNLTDHINRFWGQHLTTIVQQRRKQPADGYCAPWHTHCR